MDLNSMLMTGKFLNIGINVSQLIKDSQIIGSGLILGHIGQLKL